ncbi:MAG: hypothetical protein ABIK08_04520 [Pseudomonadota bacterium]
MKAASKAPAAAAEPVPESVKPFLRELGKLLAEAYLRDTQQEKHDEPETQQGR